MKTFKGKLAVITGAGSGIGQALAQALVSEGCAVALCDVSEQGMAETVRLCGQNNPGQVAVSTIVCDVSDEAAVVGFVDHVRAAHGTSLINLLINNAGINGGGSFVNSSRQEWERTYNICWTGTYLVTRHFLPLLLASDEGHIVNMSSANALRAVLGGHVPHTAYSTAKFAIRGFTEALIHDFRFNAPHLGVSVVMPGHTGTDILVNSMKILGNHEPESWSEKEVDEARSRYVIAGQQTAAAMTDDQIRALGAQEAANMKQLGMPVDEVAAVILAGVKANEWRILVGNDTVNLDKLVRESPERTYDADFVVRWRDANQ